MILYRKKIKNTNGTKMQGLKIQGLSPFYFSKVQLVSRLPLFANRSALALNKNTHHPKVCPCTCFHVPKLIKVVLQVSQWPAFGGSSSLGALCSLKPCRTNSQLAKKNKSPDYTKKFNFEFFNFKLWQGL